jgi:antitoxin (DNA-binding transcriptional repressor) of toxin-antitoxin stability system
MHFMTTMRGGLKMKFITIRDLRSNTARIRKDLEAEGEVVITANGRPFAVMTRVKEDNLEEEIVAIRRARAASAITRIRQKAKAEGLDRLTMEQIDAIISEARRERHAK